MQYDIKLRIYEKIFKNLHSSDKMVENCTPCYIKLLNNPAIIS